MRSAKHFINIAYGFLIGGLFYVTESAISAFLMPPLGGIATWYPFAVYFALTFAMGALSGGLCHLLTKQNPRIAVFGAVLFYVVKHVAFAAWWYIGVKTVLPDQQGTFWVAVIPRLFDVTAFVMGAYLIIFVVRRRQCGHTKDLPLQV